MAGELGLAELTSSPLPPGDNHSRTSSLRSRPLVKGNEDPGYEGEGQQEIFKNFQATTVTNRFNPLSLPHWIQHTSIRDENRDFGKTGKSLMRTGRGVLWRI